MVWSEDSIKLSNRLQVMADKVLPGETCADIGTDHGYLGRYLYESGLSPKVIMTDISEASLSKAKASCGAGQFGTDTSFRVGDGLEVIEPAEVDCVVIAGMGGHLIRDILAADMEKTRSFRRFVLQPRTAAGPLRKWLLEADFVFLSEDIVREGDFLPEIITVAPGDSSGTEYVDFDYFEFDPGANLSGGPIMDLASGIRESLVGGAADHNFPAENPEELPGEDSIHFSVPVWMLNATGPVVEFIDRRIGMQEDKLAGLHRAKAPDEALIAEAGYDIDYLNQLREIRLLREQMDAEEQA